MTFLGKKTWLLALFLGVHLLFGKNVNADPKEGTVAAKPGGSYDSGILGSESGKHSKKGSKKSSKRRHHKAKQGEATIIQNPGESQEDVSDQTEVSDQADKPEKTGKRK